MLRTVHLLHFASRTGRFFHIGSAINNNPVGRVNILHADKVKGFNSESVSRQLCKPLFQQPERETFWPRLHHAPIVSIW